MEIFLIIIIAISVTAIYDARKIAEKYFSNSDKVMIIKIIKLVAWIIGIICGLVLCYLKMKVGI